MKFYDLWPYVAVFPFISSIVFFVAAKEMDPVRRLFASIHGWAALLVLPFSAHIASQYPSLKVGVGLPGILVLGGVAAVSIFYAVAMVRVRWTYHLLHIPTVLVIATSFVGSLFVLADAH
jgi:hypothetical protein